MKDIIIRPATQEDIYLAAEVTTAMNRSAKARGTGIADRKSDTIQLKMINGEAVIALTRHGRWVGFIYMECWGNGSYISHSGLIVAPKWRRMGVATLMKKKIFELTRIKYPAAKIFGITSTLATMKINSGLGLQPVTFSEIVQERMFWNKCSSCPHYKDLVAAEFKNCFCTALLFEPPVVPAAFHE